MLRTLAQLKNQNGGHSPRMAGIVLSMFDGEDPRCLEEQRQFRDLLPTDMLLDTLLPRHKDVIEASRVGIPVGMLSGGPSAPAMAFERLCAEMELRLGMNQFTGNYR